MINNILFSQYYDLLCHESYCCDRLYNYATFYYRSIDFSLSKLTSRIIIQQPTTPTLQYGFRPSYLYWSIISYLLERPTLSSGAFNPIYRSVQPYLLERPTLSTGASNPIYRSVQPYLLERPTLSTGASNPIYRSVQPYLQERPTLSTGASNPIYLIVRSYKSRNQKRVSNDLSCFPKGTFTLTFSDSYKLLRDCFSAEGGTEVGLWRLEAGALNGKSRCYK